MRVRDVMSSPAHTCTPEESVAAAAAAMDRHGCGALPVLDELGRPAGILTEPGRLPWRSPERPGLRRRSS